MGFSPRKGNVVSQQAAKIKELEEKLAFEKHTKPMLRIFAERLGNNILTGLAQKPYKEWPEYAKTAFTWTAHEMPTAAQIYKEQLPK